MHRIVEASAGTGKTYWIEQEVLRLVKEGTPLPEILLVTFTEKATAELHERIRKRIRSALEESGLSDEVRDRLQQAELAIDQAAIFTIHGFCNQMLNDFAFEMREYFASSLASDGELRTELLPDVIRQWSDRYGENLSDLLFLSNYPDVNRRDHSSSWESSLLNIAGRMGPRDRLLPDDPVEPTSERIGRIVELIESARKALGKLSGEPKDNPVLAEYMQRAKQRSNSRKVKLLMAIGQELPAGKLAFRSIVDLFLPFQKDGLDLALTDEVSVGWITRQIAEAFKILDSMRHYLTVHSIREIGTTLTNYKRSRNLRSYDDMLLQLHDAVMRHESIRKKLRLKYKIAIIDEFQDTDSIQWEIFQKLFVESKNHSLVIVGDPKQAIYGFRGANVRIYKAATDYLLRLDPPAEVTRLETSYRSSPELVNGLNALFGTEVWFGRDYTRVSATEKRLLSDTPEPALNFLDLRHVDRAPIVRRTFSEFTASEILRVMQSDTRIDNKGKPRALRFSDFAILVKTKAETPSLERAFRAAGIPHAFYKKVGVYESREALEWSLMLKAASSLEFSAIRKALLTRFFSIPLGDLLNIEEIPANVLDRFRRWNVLATERRWSVMFAEMLRDTPILLPGNIEAIANGSGGLDPTDDFERRRANLEQIAQDLELIARQRRMNLNEMIDALQELRVAPLTQDESTLHSEESDADRVRIMTIHASKGLEFPVVFITGGFYEMNFGAFSEYFESDASQTKVLHLGVKNDERMTAQALEDVKRLYYVAFTRAQFKVYCPLFPNVNASGESKGKISSTAGPVSRLIFPAAMWLQNHINVIPAQFERTSYKTNQIVHDSTGTVQIKPYPEVARRAKGLTSYSSILRLAKSRETTSMEFGDVQKLDEVLSPASNTEAAETEGPPIQHDPTPEIPRGRRTGDALHSILESLDFAIFSATNALKPEDLPENLRKQIQTTLLRNGIDPALHEEGIVKLLWNTLNADLPGVGKLSLVTSLSPEMEFMLAVPEQNGHTQWQELVLRKGFVYGAMDLVFRHNGKYYIVDWKTNTLPTYTPEELSKSIRESHYDLQYEIYSHALISWLSSMKGYSPDWFGGVFYLYLRGIRPGSSNGIFYARPEPESLKAIGDIVDRAFGGTL